MSDRKGRLGAMPGQAMILTPAGLLLAGAICLVWSTTVTGPSRRHRLIATEALWAIAGLLALYNVAVTVYRLCTEPISTTIGNSIAAICLGATTMAAVVGLLGYVGLWAHLRPHRFSKAAHEHATRHRRATR